MAATPTAAAEAATTKATDPALPETQPTVHIYQPATSQPLTGQKPAEQQQQGSSCGHCYLDMQPQSEAFVLESFLHFLAILREIFFIQESFRLREWEDVLLVIPGPKPGFHKHGCKWVSLI